MKQNSEYSEWLVLDCLKDNVKYKENNIVVYQIINNY